MLMKHCPDRERLSRPVSESREGAAPGELAAEDDAASTMCGPRADDGSASNVCACLVGKHIILCKIALGYGLVRVFPCVEGREKYLGVEFVRSPIAGVDSAAFRPIIDWKC